MSPTQKATVVLALAGAAIAYAPPGGCAQTVLGAAGTTYVQPTFGDLHFTVGEVASSRLANGVILTEGFHQTYAQLVVSATGTPQLDVAVDIYPNPTAAQVQLRLGAPFTGQCTVTDIAGRAADRRQLTASSQETLDFSGLPAGTYVLTLRDARGRTASFQIIRAERR